jgi:hypothetical protein
MPQTTQRELPPLILHPFSTQGGPSDIIESSRAAMMLAGMLPREESQEDELVVRLLRGRWEEIRMLFFIGKDLHRWIDQCLEMVERDSELSRRVYGKGYFASLLVRYPPSGVEQKLKSWGVSDFQAIFRRALGLAAVFSQPPEPGALNPDFLRIYHRYAEAMFQSFQALSPSSNPAPGEFTFELYSSGEYARLLEEEWAG